jgi:hypothetical protein
MREQVHPSTHLQNQLRSSCRFLFLCVAKICKICPELVLVNSTRAAGSIPKDKAESICPMGIWRARQRMKLGGTLFGDHSVSQSRPNTRRPLRINGQVIGQEKIVLPLYTVHK